MASPKIYYLYQILTHNASKMICFDMLWYFHFCSLVVIISLFQLKIKNHNHLVCFYKRNAPTLILKPLKVTRMHDNPEVYIFHDLLQENEMQELRRLATPRVSTRDCVNVCVLV